MWSCTPYGSISIRPCDYSHSYRSHVLKHGSAASMAEFFSHFSICRSLMSLLHYLAFANMQKWGVELNFLPFTLHSGPQMAVKTVISTASYCTASQPGRWHLCGDNLSKNGQGTSTNHDAPKSRTGCTPCARALPMSLCKMPN